MMRRATKIPFSMHLSGVLFLVRKIAITLRRTVMT